jgi:hypothetical protein
VDIVLPQRAAGIGEAPHHRPLTRGFETTPQAATDLTETAALSLGSSCRHRQVDQVGVDHGWGQARRNPADPDVPRIGAEVAAARALIRLGHHLLGAAENDIEDIEHHPVHIHA